MALQTNADLHCLDGLLPVNSVFFSLFPVFNFAFINICVYTVPLSQEVYSVKIMWVYNIASISMPFNLLFLVYHYHEQNI
jgi:hypothetical protein